MTTRHSIVLRQRVDQRKLARARELRREMTPAEQTLWKALRRNRIDGHHFRRQQVIAGFIVDFYCHQAGLVIEVDGEIHAASGSYYRQRDLELERYGLQVLRVKNVDVLTNLPKVLASVRAEIAHSSRPMRRSLATEEAK